MVGQIRKHNSPTEHMPTLKERGDKWYILYLGDVISNHIRFKLIRIEHTNQCADETDTVVTVKYTHGY